MKTQTPETKVSDHPYEVTSKQREVMSVIARGNEDGSLVDKGQILSRVTYDSKISNICFILRYMIAQKRVRKAAQEKRGSRYVTTFAITKLGRHLITTDDANGE